jgi:hypothetical protein
MQNGIIDGKTRLRGEKLFISKSFTVDSMGENYE